MLRSSWKEIVWITQISLALKHSAAFTFYPMKVRLIFHDKTTDGKQIVNGSCNTDHTTEDEVVDQCENGHYKRSYAVYDPGRILQHTLGIIQIHDSSDQIQRTYNKQYPLDIKTQQKLKRADDDPEDRIDLYPFGKRCDQGLSIHWIVCGGRISMPFGLCLLYRGRLSAFGAEQCLVRQLCATINTKHFVHLSRIRERFYSRMRCLYQCLCMGRIVSVCMMGLYHRMVISFQFSFPQALQVQVTSVFTPFSSTRCMIPSSC